MTAKIRYGLGAVLLVAAGFVQASCPLPPETNAISVQNNAGQGGFACEDLSANGIVLRDLATWPVLQPIATITCSDGNTLGNGNCKSGVTLDWKIREDAADPDEYYQVFLVSAVHGGAGSACNYLYAAEESVQEGDKLGDVLAGKGDTDASLVCGDPNPKPRTEPREITVIDTEAGNCTTEIYVGDDPIATQQSTFGYFRNADGSRRFSSCGNTKDAGGLSPKNAPENEVTGQVSCEPPGEGGYTTQIPFGNCTTLGPYGELPLSCAPVDVNAVPDGKETCWAFENKVCRGHDNDPAYCFCRPEDGATNCVVDGVEYSEGDRIRPFIDIATFIPTPLTDTVNVDLNVFEEGTCITQYFYGVAYHTCW